MPYFILEHLKRKKKIPNRRIIVARSIFIFRYHLNDKFEFESKADSVCIELGVCFLSLILFYLLKKNTQTLTVKHSFNCCRSLGALLITSLSLLKYIYIYIYIQKRFITTDNFAFKISNNYFF